MFSISDQRFDALPLRVSATFKNSHFCHDGKAEILSSLSQHLKLAVHGYLVGFICGAANAAIYPQRNDAECITLSEACMEDHVAVEIRSTETGMCFEEHVTCDEDGNLNHAERDLSRCKCRNCGEISLFGSFEDLDDAECSECGECGFDRCEEE